MSRLAGDLDDEAIGESDRSLACERRVRSSDDVLILQDEAIVLYEHAHSGPDAPAVQPVDGLQHPYGLGAASTGSEIQAPVLDERLGAGDLFRIVAHDQPDCPCTFVSTARMGAPHVGPDTLTMSATLLRAGGASNTAS